MPLDAEVAVSLQGMGEERAHPVGCRNLDEDVVSIEERDAEALHEAFIGASQLAGAPACEPSFQHIPVWVLDHHECHVPGREEVAGGSEDLTEMRALRCGR